MRRRHRWMAVFVSMGLVLSSCADDDDDEGGGDTETGDLLSYDESDKCGTDEYGGNLAKLEAVDEMTVEFTLCAPDPALPAKTAFSSLGIWPQEVLEEMGQDQGALSQAPVGTGPYMLEEGNWKQGEEVVLTAYEDYWGDAAKVPTVVVRWSEEPSQRLLELDSGNVDGIDNVAAQDFEAIEGNDELQLHKRDLLNVLYLGFNVDTPPMDNEKVRQAIGYAIDKQRLVENYYPEGTEVANQFLSPGIPFYQEDAEGYTHDQNKAKQLLTDAGFPDGVDLGKLSYRNTPRPYLEQPPQVASDIKDQLAQVGITVELEEQESTAFIDNANAGTLGLHLLGWNADFPDPTNYWDAHFGAAAGPQFGEGFDDLHEVLTEAGQTLEDEPRQDLYNEANEIFMQRSPAIPLVYGASAVAFQADVEDAHASPLANEQLAVMGAERDQLVWMQGGEPGGLYCADETDGEALRVCEQINESLLAYETGGTEVVPSLAEEMPESNDDATVWTFKLREGVTFHDGSDLDANDVVKSYRVIWDAEDPLHVGREGTFDYWGTLFNGFVNPPPEE